MTRASPRLFTLLLTASALVGCTNGVELVGGTAQQTVTVVDLNGNGSSVNPVCDATQSFRVMAAGFEPLFADALHGAAPSLPTVTVTRRQDLSHSAVEPLQVATVLMDTGASSAASWYSGVTYEVRFTEPPVPPGFYEVALTSAAGGAPVAARDLMKVTPRPVLTSLSPTAVCSGDAVDLVVRGDHLGTTETLMVGRSSVQATGFDCSPSELGTQCQGLKARIQLGYSSQSEQVSLLGTACASTPGPTLSLARLGQSTLSQASAAANSCGTQARIIDITGTNLYVVDGVGPVVTIGTHQFPSRGFNCTSVQFTGMKVEACDALAVDVPAGVLAAGTWNVSVASPSLPGCAPAQTTLTLLGDPGRGPTLTSVSLACVGERRVTLTGTGLNLVTLAQVDGVVARILNVKATGTFATIELGPTTTPGTKTLVLSSSGGCQASATVTVLAGAELLGVDLPVINGALGGAVTAWASTLSPSAHFSLQSADGTSTFPLASLVTRPGEVRLAIPANTAAGQYDLLLRDTSACGARLVDALTINGAAPSVLTVSPRVVSALGRASLSVDGAPALLVPRASLLRVGSSAWPVPLPALTTLGPQRFSVTLPSSVSAGDYTLVLVGSDGTSARTTTPLQVVAAPAPVVTARSPSSALVNAAQPYTLEGQDFRSPTMSVRCARPDGSPVAKPAPTVDSSSPTAVSGTFDAWTPGVCVLRVTNDDGTTVESAPIEVHAAGQPLGTTRIGPSLAGPRRAPVALATEVFGAPQLHVLSGDLGTVPTALVESSPLDAFGAPGPFVMQRERLGQARTNAAGVAIGRWLYLVGGTAGGAALDSVERAEVLDPAAAEELTDLSFVPASTGFDPAHMTWRVAAVLSTGEQVASEGWQVLVPAVTSGFVQVTLSWRGTPGALKYRVYRGAWGDTLGRLVAELDAPTTSFTDVGAPTTSTVAPLLPGATGPWQTLPAHLSMPREGAGVTWAMDPSDPTRAYVYVFGGRQDAAHLSDTFEFLPLTLDASGAQQPSPAFTAGAVTLGRARWQLGASAATHESSSRILAGQSWLYVLSGLDVSGSVESTCEAAQVLPGGQLGALTALPPLSRAASGQVVVDDRVLVFGGEAAPGVSTARADLCVTGATGCSGVGPWSAGEPMGTSRGQPGVARSGAFIYVVGGLGTPFAATNSVEFRTW